MYILAHKFLLPGLQGLAGKHVVNLLDSAGQDAGDVPEVVMLCEELCE